jgi:hypothetical protein
MRKYFVFTCLALLAIAVFAADTKPAETSHGLEVNGVTPTATVPTPTQPPAPTPTPPPT